MFIQVDLLQSACAYLNAAQKFYSDESPLTLALYSTFEYARNITLLRPSYEAHFRKNVSVSLSDTVISTDNELRVDGKQCSETQVNFSFSVPTEFNSVRDVIRTAFVVSRAVCQSSKKMKHELENLLKLASENEMPSSVVLHGYETITLAMGFGLALVVIALLSAVLLT